MKAEEQISNALKGLQRSEILRKYLNERAGVPYVSQPNQHHRVMKGITCKSKPLFLTHFPKSNSLHCFLGEGEGPPPPRARVDAYRSRALSLSGLSSDFRVPALPPHERRRRRSLFAHAAASGSRYPSRLAPRHFRFCRGGGAEEGSLDFEHRGLDSGSELSVCANFSTCGSVLFH